jgi:hypothetical protein
MKGNKIWLRRLTAVSPGRSNSCLPVRSISLAVVAAQAVALRGISLVSRFVVGENGEQIAAPPDRGFAACASTV